MSQLSLPEIHKLGLKQIYVSENKLVLPPL